MAYIDRKLVCENCNNKNYCDKKNCPVYKISPADVVPKGEVLKILDEIEKTICAALVLIRFIYKNNPESEQCRKECYEDFLGYIVELKKKYNYR